MGILPSSDPKAYFRILRYASKPSSHEMKIVSGVAGGGIFLVGLLGFIIYTILSYLPL